MPWPAPALGALVAAAAAALRAFPRRAAGGPAPDWSVQAKRLLGRTEQQVFERLRTAFPQHVVLAQVSFERLLGMRRSHGSAAVFRRYQRLVADCVICSREFMPLVVVELRQAAPGSTRRTRAQVSKADVLGAAGLVYVTVDAAARPDAATLRALIRAALPRRPPAAAVAPAPASGVPAAAVAASPPQSRRIDRPAPALAAAVSASQRPSRVA